MREKSTEDRFFINIIDTQIPEIDTDKPIVIFIDGVGTTRNRKEHDLLDERFGDSMMKAAMQMCENVPCRIYQISDEISIIVDDVKKFARNIGASYCTHDELSSLAAQAFVPVFCSSYGKSVRFHIRIHSIAPEDRDRYIAWRKTYVRNAVYTYFAIRSGVWRRAYSDYDEDEIKQVLRRAGLSGKLKDIKRFVDGREYISESCS